MTVNKEKCKVLHLRKYTTRHQYMLVATQLESSMAEKDLRELVDTKLNMRQQHILAVKKARGRDRAIPTSLKKKTSFAMTLEQEPRWHLALRKPETSVRSSICYPSQYPLPKQNLTLL